MAKTNRLILLTILYNCLIIVGVGHGGGPLGMVEFMFLHELLAGNLAINFTGSYSERMPASAIFALTGQLLLILSCLPKRPLKTYFALTGLGILLFSFVLLVFDFSTASPDILSLVFGVPFLYTAIRLLLYLRKKEKTVIQ